MNWFEKFLYMLQVEMERPKAFGWFHLLWICLIIGILLFLFFQRKNNNDKQLKWILGTYGIIALLLELVKQLIWSFNYDPSTNVVVWDYEWYAAPFQLCTTPIFVSIVCLFLKDNKLRNSLLSYMAYITILGSITTILIPDSCFVSDIMVNIHTMWLHCGSFVVSVYLLMNGIVKINIKNLIHAFITFLVFVALAQILNIAIYNSGLLNGETFNMFYISPYFISTLPVFDVIQKSVPFILYQGIYLFAVFVGALIIYFISYFINDLFTTAKKTS